MKIGDWSVTAGYMSAKGMPVVPFFLIMAIIFELLGGLSVLLGYKAKFGAWLLIIFLIPTTLIFHNFWGLEDPDRQVQVIMFMKNLAILGGLFIIAALGAGKPSFDEKGKS